MTVTDWAHLAAVVVVLAWWGRGTVRALEWVDLQRDQARARQHRMAPAQWVKVHAVAALPRWIVAGPATAAAVGIGVAAWRYPTVAWAGIGLGLVVNGVRNAVADPSDIAQLRQALGQIIGVDDRARPPKVRRDGTHPSGGPLRITLAGHPGFKYWEKAKREQVEHAIEATLPGDWEVVEWRGDGTSEWERLPELPEFVEYAGPIEGLAWHQLPIGVGGDGEYVTADLYVHPHWFVAGSTGFGKTSLLRVWAAHLLHHGKQVAALDIQGTGLGFLENRPGVTVAATDSYKDIENAVAWLWKEMEERRLDLKRHGRYREPLVVFVDELESLCRRARAEGFKAKNAREPQLISQLQDLTARGRRFDIYMILATQRPEGKTIPLDIRDNALGRCAVGPLGQQAAKMVLDDQWPRAMNTPRIKGRIAARKGDWCGWVHGPFMGDPDDSKHGDAAQHAEALLPARTHTPQGVSAIPPPGSGGANDHAAHTVGVEMGRKWAPDSPPASDTVGDAATPSETAEERRKRLKRESDNRYKARVRKEVLNNPQDKRHGTSTGRITAGCRCPKCRPELHVDELQEVSS